MMGVNNSASRKNTRRTVAVKNMERNIILYKNEIKSAENRAKAAQNKALPLTEEKCLQDVEKFKNKLKTTQRDLAATKQKLA